MIYNRTIEDVNAAKKIIEEKVKKFLDLTSEDIKQLERGILTTESINRIENKQEEIRSLLNEAGYYNNFGINKIDWQLGDYFMQSDLDRLVRNVELLKNSIKLYPDTPSIPSPVYHYEEINKMEKILYDLEHIIGEVVANYRECGTFYCGE